MGVIMNPPLTVAGVPLFQCAPASGQTSSTSVPEI